ncbi:MAG: hypothetical protein ACTSRZ_05565 [Promethearchaeota archaeon]
MSISSLYIAFYLLNSAQYTRNNGNNAVLQQNIYEDLINENDIEASINGTGWPLVLEDLTAENDVFSPKNQDGILDTVSFSFRTLTSVEYNYTIEVHENMTNYISAFASVAGDSSNLFMVYTNSRSYNGDSSGTTTIYIKTSTDGGKTWDVPLETNLQLSSVGCYYDLKLVYNSSSNDLFLMVTRYLRIFPFNDDYEIAIYKANGGDFFWNRIAESDSVLQAFKSDHRGKLNHDFIISNNNSVLYGVITNTTSNNVIFIKSEDGGNSWSNNIIANRPVSGGIYSPSIAMAPDNTLTVVWWEKNSKHFYISNSTNFGASWSIPVLISEAQGIGLIEIPYNIGHPNTPGDSSYESGSFELEYDSSGNLYAMFIYNSTKIYSAISTNGGFSWKNVTQFRNFGTAKVYNIDFDILNDGNQTISYSGYLAGLENPGSSYFLNRNVVKHVFNQNAIAGVKEIFYWDGKDDNDSFVEDGYYLCALTMKDLVINQTYPNKLYAKVKVDNHIGDPGISIDYNYISPLESENIQDKTTISFFPFEENLYYSMFVRQYSYSKQNEVRITTNEVGQMAADVAFDRFNKMHCVYVSYEENDRDLFYKTSDNFGVSFSIKIPLVKQPFFDDCPAIAIHGDNIYVVFMRYHEKITNPNEYVYDLFFMQSNDLGTTWSIPVNITAGEFTSVATTNYYCPDILVTSNGTIIIAYNAHKASSRNWYIIKSIDNGSTFSTPILIGPQYKRSGQAYYYGKPISLAYNDDDDILFVAYPNKSASANKYSVYLKNSTDLGDSWSNGIEIFTMFYDYMITGVTLDYIGNQTLQMAYYYYDANIAEGYAYYSNSNDNGITWSADKYLFSETLEGGSTPSSYKHYAYLKSGSNQLGDIFYVYAYTDSFSNNLDVHSLPFTKTIYHTSGSSPINTQQDIEWNGLDYWGLINDGQYNITLIINDDARNQYIFNTFCIVDNQSPDIFLDIFDTSDMSPSKPQTIAALNATPIAMDTSVDLYYRFSGSSSWTTEPAIYNGTHFTAQIPATSSDVVYFYMNATDLAGNSAITEELNYFDIVFNLSPDNIHFTPYSKDPERKLDDKMEFSVTNLDWTKVQTVYLNYTINDVNSTIVEMQFVNGEKYVYTLEGSQQYYKLEYVIIIIDIKNQNHTYSVIDSNAITQEYIPLFPEIIIDYPLNLYIVIISAIVGVVAGLFTTISRNRDFRKIKNKFEQNIRLYTKTFEKPIKKSPETTVDSEKSQSIEKTPEIPKNRKSDVESPKKTEKSMKSSKIEKILVEIEYVVRGKLIFFIGFVGTIACIVVSLLSIAGLFSGTVGLLIGALGLLLSTLTLMEKILIDISEGIYNHKKNSKLPIIVIIGLMAVILGCFMSAGRLIDWFNYYIVQDTFTIGPFEIPNLWLSLTTPFLSIIMFITVTTYKNLDATMKEMDALLKSGQNWKDIWKTKQERISVLNSAVQLKLVIFIATIAFSIVSATKIGRYAQLGMLLLVPFILAMLAVFTINKIRIRKEEKQFQDIIDSWLIQKTKFCPNCNEENLFDNLFCTKCKYDFSKGTIIIEETKICKECNFRSPIDAVFCRYCGNEFADEQK